MAILARTEKSIYAAIHKYARKPADVQELHAQGVLLVLECIQSYEPEKGVPFLAYIHTKLKHHYLQTWGEKQLLSLDAEREAGDGTLLDLLPAEDDTEAEILRKEQQKAVQQALKRLTLRERKCVEGFYYYHLSIGEIAESLGIAYRTACNNKTRGLKKLKRFLAEYEENIQGGNDPC